MKAGDLIEIVRTIELDHGPGGWPAVEMSTLSALADEVERLLRWKSTNAPRLEALQGLLHAAHHEAHAGREAIATLDSERAANALLTDEVERLRVGLLDAIEELESWSAYTSECFRQKHDFDGTFARLRAHLGPNAEVSGCMRAPMPEDAPRTAAGSPLDRPVGPVAGA